MTDENPLEMIFRDIKRAIEAGFYYHAIIVSLSLPDVCAALACDPGLIWVTEKKYVSWCEENLEKKFTYFTAQDCYRLRCGVIHQGNFGHPKARYDRVLFTLPSKIKIGEARVGGRDGSELILSLDCATFCDRMIGAAQEWLQSKAADVNVQTNLQNIVRLRPEGILLSVLEFRGVPVIA